MLGVSIRVTYVSWLLQMLGKPIPPGAGGVDYTWRNRLRVAISRSANVQKKKKKCVSDLIRRRMLGPHTQESITPGGIDYASRLADGVEYSIHASSIHQSVAYYS